MTTNNFWTLRTLSVVTCSLLVALLGVICFDIWGIPAIIKIEIHKQTQLEEHTDQWNRFIKLPFPIEFKIHFFKVLNVDNLKNGSDTQANVMESRPFSYNLSIKKTNISLSKLDDSITYTRSMDLKYNNNQGYDDSEKATIANPVLMAALQITSSIDRIALAGCLTKIFTNGMDKLFITQPVKQLVMEGITFAYENVYIGAACGLIRSKTYDIVKHIRPIEVKGPDNNRHIKFSMFNWKRSSYSKPSPDGYYSVLRGRNELTQLGQIIRWNNSHEIKIWGNGISLNNDTCKKVRGTDSTIFPPQLNAGGSLDNFSTDICRIINIKYRSKESFSGIEGYRYETPNTTFWSQTQNPENDCFCSKSTTNQDGKDDCYLDGVFDFKPCLGAPILLSFPHFETAKEKYKKAVNISKETNYSSDFQTYLLVEPNTGIPLQGRIRIQMNLIFRPEFLLDQVTPTNMSRIIIPILWLEESFDLPDAYVKILHDQYFSKVALARAFKYGSVAVIAALLVVSVFFLIRKIYTGPKRM